MNKKMSSFSVNQLGALITLFAIAIWGVWISWLHITRPLGIDDTEILFLSAVIPVCLVLIPFYVLRVRWSYISGIIIMLLLFIGVVFAVIVARVFFFSVSLYNLTTILVLIGGAACIYFSLRSFLELQPVGWVKSIFGIIFLLALSACAVWLVSANDLQVENYIFQQVIHGVQDRTSEFDQLDEKIEALMAEGDIRALAAAIVVDDEILWIKGYGEVDTLDKMHDIGSITKSFVATAVLQLYEKGYINLDDDVNQYLPFDVRHPDYPEVPITIHMLLTHRSCLAHKTLLYDSYVMSSDLRQWSEGKLGWESRAEFEFLPYSEFYAGYLNPGGPYYQPETWANCQPGTEFIYSTPGYDLLAYLVEQVSGQLFGDYLQENIFSPLKMTNTTPTPLDNPDGIAAAKERIYGVLTKTSIDLPNNQRRIAGGGGLYSTAEDLADFLLAHMNKGRHGNFQLLQPETISLMHSPIRTQGGDFMQVGYGYGWGIYQDEPRQMWDITFQPRGYQGHGGSYLGYLGAMYMVEEQQGAYGYVLLTNTSHVVKTDYPWHFATNLNIGNLILQEAHRIFQASVNQ